VLLPLVAVFASEWGVTGAAVAVLCSAVAFGLAWLVAIVRLRSEVAALAPRPTSAPIS
jgi:Na+-driven multidrug efflux pump